MKHPCVDFRNVAVKPVLGLTQAFSEAVRSFADRMRSSCDFSNDIFGAGRTFNISEKENPALSLEPASKFLGDAGLAHASLAGQQHMVAVFDYRIFRRPKKSPPLTQWNAFAA